MAGHWRSAALSSVGLALLACAGLDGWPPSESGLERSSSASASATDSSDSTRGSLFGAWNSLRGDGYALDGVERWLQPGQRVVCDPNRMVSYAGKHLRYAGRLLVAPEFIERLERFESVAAEVAREVYGRSPKSVRHYGSFNCRATRNRKHVVSEHALGNALDLVGFDFGPATKTDPLPAGHPPRLRAPFQVRVAKHWAPGAASDPVQLLHARFWAALSERLRQRDDIFRSMFGPGHGGHDDHLHLDAAPYRYVDL